MNNDEDGAIADFYRLDDLKHGAPMELADGVVARVFMGDNSMLSVASFEPNTISNIHEHPEEQWGVLLEGSGTRIQDGIEHEVTPGDFWRTPGGVPHGFAAGPEGAKILDVFSPPRDIYRNRSR